MPSTALTINVGMSGIEIVIAVATVAIGMFGPRTSWPQIVVDAILAVLGLARG